MATSQLLSYRSKSAMKKKASGKQPAPEGGFAQQFIQPLKEAFTAIVDSVKQFSAHAPPEGSQGLEADLNELPLFVNILDEINDIHNLQSRLGGYVCESFAYFHNKWVIRHYLPTVQRFEKQLSQPEAPKIMGEAVKLTKDAVGKFDHYLKLQSFFEGSRPSYTVESAFKEAEDAILRARQKISLRPKKKEEFLKFAKRLSELRAEAPIVETCRSVCDAFDRLKALLWQDVYKGPLPPIYRVQGFRLEVKMAEFLKLKSRPDQERETAFPVRAPPAQAVDCLEALQNQRANMQAKYRHALEQFERSVNEDLGTSRLDLAPLPLAQRDRAEKKAKRKTQQAIDAIRAEQAPKIEALRRKIEEAEKATQEHEAAVKLRARETTLSGEITDRKSKLETIERSAAAEFATLHAMMAIAHRHLRTELATLVALGAAEVGEGADPIGAELTENGTITGILAGLDQDWTNLAY
jgi:hypothetical protein